MQTKKLFATTVNYYRDEPRFTAHAHILDVPPIMEQPSSFRLRTELTFLLRILRTALAYKVLLLFSHRGHITPELLSAVLMGFWPRRLRPQIVFHGEMYEPDSGWRYWLQRLAMRLADRAIAYYIVYSAAEMTTFSQAWGVDRAKMRFALHPFYGKRKERTATFIPPAAASYVFAGGNSFRDYGPLVEAARLLPSVNFVICTNQLAACRDLPANVSIRHVTHAEFIELMRNAGVVIVPIQRNTQRIAGALTYLDAMWLRKPTIVTAGLGVSEYVQDGETGWIVDGSPADYVSTLRWILDPSHVTTVERICANAHAAVDTRFSMESHVSQLLNVMDELVMKCNIQKGATVYG